MRAILPICLAGHWTVWFALQAEGLIDAFVASGSPAAGLLAGSFLFAASLYGWVAAAALMQPGTGAIDTEIASLATAVAIAAVAVAGTCAMSVSRHGLIEIAALSASYLALRRAGETDMPARSTAPAGQLQTRLMARHAAHGTMMSRVAGRERPPRGEGF